MMPAQVQVQILHHCVLFPQSVIEHNRSFITHNSMKVRSIIHYLFGKEKESVTNTRPQREISLAKYLGRWYEQARYENWFEAGMDEVFTDYSAGPEGCINILNCGRTLNGRQSTSRGRAYPCGSGRLKVSFVPPYGWFQAPYHILYTDPDYQTALVSGKGDAYLWLLTRQKMPDRDALNRLIQEAQKRGFNTDRLRFTRQ